MNRRNGEINNFTATVYCGGDYVHCNIKNPFNSVHKDFETIYKSFSQNLMKFWQSDLRIIVNTT